VYDAKNEAHEFTGADRNDCIEQACQYYEMEADKLDIMGFEPGAVYGLATRALIVAAPKDRTAPPPRGSDDDGRRESRGRGGRDRGDRDRGDRGGRGRGRDRDDRGRDDRGRDDRGRDDRGRDDRGRDDRGRDDRGGRGGRGGREERSRDERPANDRPKASTAPSVGTASGELGDISKFVLGVIERMTLGPFEISEGTDNELTVVEVKGEAARALAANEGRTVDALQLLANQVAVLNGPDRPRVVIDIEGNDDAREEFLSKLADRVAKRALQTGRPVALDPMNGRDRRMIHIALRDREDVATMSEGEGRYRQVVVVPEGADEFEEAKASKGAGS
jgi:spoIIIJ-associated protein